MPRLHALADKNRFNHYDCLFYGKRGKLMGASDQHAHVRLFGSANIGNELLSNLPQARSLNTNDQTSYIQNWYARTNIPTSRLLDEYANTAVVTLFVGDKTTLQLSMRDLLTRAHEDELAAIATNQDEMVDDIAKAAYLAYCEARRKDPEWPIADEAKRRAWKAAGWAAMQQIRPPSVVIVPVRQVVHVNVEQDVAALRRLIDSVPDDVEASPGLWIHLEGFSRRDVC